MRAACAGGGAGGCTHHVERLLSDSASWFGQPARLPPSSGTGGRVQSAAAGWVCGGCGLGAPSTGLEHHCHHVTDVSDLLRGVSFHITVSSDIMHVTLLDGGLLVCRVVVMMCALATAGMELMSGAWKERGCCSATITSPAACCWLWQQAAPQDATRLGRLSCAAVCRLVPAPSIYSSFLLALLPIDRACWAATSGPGRGQEDEGGAWPSPPRHLHLGGPVVVAFETMACLLLVVVAQNRLHHATVCLLCCVWNPVHGRTMSVDHWVYIWMICCCCRENAPITAPRSVLLGCRATSPPPSQPPPRRRAAASRGEPPPARQEEVGARPTCCSRNQRRVERPPPGRRSSLSAWESRGGRGRGASGAARAARRGRRAPGGGGGGAAAAAAAPGGYVLVRARLAPAAAVFWCRRPAGIAGDAAGRDGM